MSKDKLQVVEIKGRPRDAGYEYGQRFATPILGFCRQELVPDKKRVAYAAQCLPYVKRDAPSSFAFMQGMAAATGMSIEHMVLISLHEEIYHTKHCTAFVANGSATRHGEVLNGQNWDWAPNLYPWPGLLKLSLRREPRAVTYHYPGLWAGAGINEHGLSLMWTGGGYFPRIKPVVGLPTYVIISRILRLTSVAQALAFLSSVRNAGCFIFFLADPHGPAAVVEGVPGKKHVEFTDNHDDVLARANHYVCRDVLKCGRQVKPSRTRGTTLQRHHRIHELIRQHHGRIDLNIGKRILIDRHGRWPWLHQYPDPRSRDGVTLGGMTIDSLLADCTQRVLHTCRGGRAPGPWQAVAL